MKERCAELLEYEMSIRDDVSRTNATRRHKEIGQYSQATVYDLRVGDEVSIDGQKCEILEVEGPPGRHAVARVRGSNGKERKVRYDFLRPLAVGRPVHLISSKRAEVGDFVMFKDEGEVCGAVVVRLSGGASTIHMHEGNEAGRSWLPLWKRESGRITRSRTAPVGSTPMQRELEDTELEMVGRMGPTNYLTDQTMAEAKSLGLL